MVRQTIYHYIAQTGWPNFFWTTCMHPHVLLYSAWYCTPVCMYCTVPPQDRKVSFELFLLFVVVVLVSNSMYHCMDHVVVQTM